jgi:hypothetical protein
MSKVLSVLVLSLAATSAANAFEHAPPWAQRAVANHEALVHDRDAGSKATTSATDPAAAPEIDPAGAMSAFTLLAGGLAVLRGRRFRKRQE